MPERYRGKNVTVSAMIGVAAAASAAIIFNLAPTALGKTSPAARRNAARTASAVASRAKENARRQRVIDELNKALQSRVTSPGGKPHFLVRPSSRAGDGYFEEIFIAARPAQIKKLRLTELVLRARNVQVDVNQLLREHKLNTVKSQTFLRAIVTERDLMDVLAQGKHSAEMGLKVKFLGDQVRVNGNWKWNWFSGPVVAVGRLYLAPGHKVNCDVKSLTLNGNEVPGYVKTKFMEKLNPLIDYSDVPFQPRFRSVKVVGTRAIITA